MYQQQQQQQQNNNKESVKETPMKRNWNQPVMK